MEILNLDNDQLDYSAKQALDKWDKGEILWTASMGGLGPGYEQCIHMQCFEILRSFINAKLARFEVIEGVDHPEYQTYTKTADAARLVEGLTGAQFGAARHLAFKIYMKGYENFKDSIPEDRRIMVSNEWPKLREAEPTAEPVR